MKASTNNRHQAQALTRKGALQQTTFLASLAFLSAVSVAPTTAQAKESKPAGAPFEEGLSYLLAAKKVLDPVKKYITIGQFDPARSNIKYASIQLRLKKNMERTIQLALERDADVDKIDAAAEGTAVIDNTLSQLDSSVYTQIFIPSEGELNPAAFKYRDQAFGFYNEVMTSIDNVLALASPEDIKAAEKLMAKVDLPPFLFKEFKNEFYRPATP